MALSKKDAPMKPEEGSLIYWVMHSICVLLVLRENGVEQHYL